MSFALRDVSLEVEGRPVLRDLSFSIAERERVVVLRAVGHAHAMLFWVQILAVPIKKRLRRKRVQIARHQ